MFSKSRSPSPKPRDTPPTVVSPPSRVVNRGMEQKPTLLPLPPPRVERKVPRAVDIVLDEQKKQNTSLKIESAKQRQNYLRQTMTKPLPNLDGTPKSHRKGMSEGHVLLEASHTNVSTLLEKLRNIPVDAFAGKKRGDASASVSEVKGGKLDVKFVPKPASTPTAKERIDLQKARNGRESPAAVEKERVFSIEALKHAFIVAEDKTFDRAEYSELANNKSSPIIKLAPNSKFEAKVVTPKNEEIPSFHQKRSPPPSRAPTKTVVSNSFSTVSKSKPIGSLHQVKLQKTGKLETLIANSVPLSSILAAEQESDDVSVKIRRGTGYSFNRRHVSSGSIVSNDLNFNIVEGEEDQLNESIRYDIPLEPLCSSVSLPQSEEAQNEAIVFINQLFQKADAENSEKLHVENAKLLSYGGSVAYCTLFEYLEFYTLISAVYLRNCNIGDDFVESLMDFLREGRLLSLEVLDLEGNNLSHEGLLMIGSIIEMGYDDECKSDNSFPEPNLVEINVSNQLLQIPPQNVSNTENCLLNALKKNLKLLKFKFNFQESSKEALSQQYLLRNTAFVRFAMQSLKEESLKSLLSSGEAELEVMRLMKKFIEDNPNDSMEELEIIDEPEFRILSVRLKISFARAIGKSHCVKTVKLIGLDLNDEFISALSAEVKVNAQSVLEELILDYNSITGDGIVQVVELASIGPIREISILGQQEENPLTEILEARIIQLVEKCKYLTSLKLDFREVTTGKAVLRAISRNQKILKKSVESLR